MRTALPGCGARTAARSIFSPFHASRGSCARRARAGARRPPRSFSARRCWRRSGTRSGGRATSGRAGHGIVPERPSGAAARFAQCRYRALHGKRATLCLFRLGWRPPARHQPGRRPSGFLTNDHADGATLGRQERPRRPELPGGLLTEERTELLLSWRHTGFSVHNRVRVEPEDQPAVERLARYIMRPPISLERIRWDGDGEVFYQPKGGHDGRARPPGDVAEAFDPAEFLARVIMHIPEPRGHLVRYYGAYSNVSRGKRRRQTETAVGVSPCDSEQAPSARADRDHSPDARALRRSWAQLIKRVYEVDPLVCPSCGGEMRIIAFIIDHDVVDAILRHLAKAEARSPRGPPSAAALSAVS